MTDSFAAVLGFALIIGLFVWYGVDRRKRRAAQRATAAATTGPPPVPAAPAPTPEPVTEVPEAEAAAPRRFSVGEFLALPFVLAFLLFVVSAHLHDIWGTVWSVVFLAIAVALGGTSLWTLVRGERDRDPAALPRWMPLAVLLGYGVLPLVGWYLVVLARQSAGVLVPLVPAVVLGACFAVARLLESRRRS